jgi:hypothetical protein
MFKAHRFLPAMFAVLVLTGTAACASQGPRYGTQGRARIVDNRAYGNGYDEGRSRGESDARRGRSFDYGRHDDYRDADDGYRGNGNRNSYRQAFRQGFVEGYNDGYRRHARNGIARRSGPVYDRSDRYPGYASPAIQNGYRDGIDQGRQDARDRRRFDPVRAPRYRSGDRDYNGRYGSRDEYKREYRAAFQQGYEQGYREYRR